MKYQLLVDVISNYSDKKGNHIFYGRKGDIVILISTHTNTLIVEGSSGRFPVRIEKVKKL